MTQAKPAKQTDAAQRDQSPQQQGQSTPQRDQSPLQLDQSPQQPDQSPKQQLDQPPRLGLAGLRSTLAGPFDLAVAAGECVAIAGPSGSGKSLLLRMIADLDPNQGDVALDGRDRRTFTPPAWRRRVVYSAAEPGWWHDTVAPHFPAGAAADLAHALMPRLGLQPAQLDSQVARLSTGERQRLALIRALALDPPVLLLDEPTGALDQDSTARVETLLRERMAAGTTILIVTHSPEQAGRLGHQHFRMRDRRLVPA